MRELQLRTGHVVHYWNFKCWCRNANKCL